MARTAPPEIHLQGIAASEGIAFGPAFLYIQPDLCPPARTPQKPTVEIGHFHSACEQARGELQALRARVAARPGGGELAAIFDAHELMLDDPLLTERVVEKVQAGMLIEQAVLDATGELAGMLAAMEDELFAARAADIQDVGRRVVRILLGLPDTALNSLKTPSVIVARDLTPSDTANLEPDLALGFCTAEGGLTSHSAILARTLGIPAVVGLGAALLDKVQAGVDLVLDGGAGVVIAHPGEKTAKSYRETRSRLEARMQELKAGAGQLAHTLDGRRVEVAANIGEVETAREAVEFGAEGVGLLRTEFLYLNETRAPSEQQQVDIYRAIFAALDGRPVIIRTLDIGGDKPPSYLPFPEEMNPFLGWRAIRMCLDDPALFKTQLRAILRAAVGHDVRIMFPMIIGLDELRAARALLAEAAGELRAAGQEFAAALPVGIMVETPAAAVLVEQLAEAADFFSLGTNDLTQYTLAVDRGNQKVAGLFQPLHPGVLRMIKLTIDGAHARGKWVGMCGELAGMQKAIPILLGLGLDEFSMAARSIPAAKRLIGRLSDARAREIAAQALSLATAAQIEAFMQGVLQELA